MHRLAPSVSAVLLREVHDYAEESGRPVHECFNEALEEYLSKTVARREAKEEAQRNRRLPHRRPRTV